MMRTLVAVLAGAGLGMLAGTAFYGGLAATVRRLHTVRRPALTVAGSFLVRLAFVAVVLAAVAGWLPPVGLLGAAAGLLVGRVLVVHGSGRRIGPPRERATVSPGR